MFRPDTRIIQSGRNGIYRGYLTVFILTKVRFHSMKNPQSSGIDGGRRFKGIYASPRCLTTNQAYFFILYKVVEASDSVGAAAHTGNHSIRQSALLLKNLLLYLPGDHRLKITNNCWKRMWSHNRTKTVMGILNSGGPLPHSFRYCIL